jgi:Tfp pilus assembly protein PilO
MEQQLQQLTFGKAFIGAIVVAFLYFMLMYNDGSAIEAAIVAGKSEIQTKEQELEKIKVAIADAERYQQTKNALGSELETVLKAIPEKLLPTDIMKFLSTEAKNIGVNIINLNAGSAAFNQSVKPGEEKPFFEPVSVSITLEGTYTNLMLFLSAITKSDKIITAPSLVLETKGNPITDDSGPTSLRLVAEFRAYRYLLPDAGAKAK